VRVTVEKSGTFFYPDTVYIDYENTILTRLSMTQVLTSARLHTALQLIWFTNIAPAYSALQMTNSNYVYFVVQIPLVEYYEIKGECTV